MLNRAPLSARRLIRRTTTLRRRTMGVDRFTAQKSGDDVKVLGLNQRHPRRAFGRPGKVIAGGHFLIRPSRPATVVPTPPRMGLRSAVVARPGRTSDHALCGLYVSLGNNLDPPSRTRGSPRPGNPPLRAESLAATPRRET
jgi:hypothetical protein